MSQLNEGWASRTQEERDEMTEKEDAQKIIGLVKKYGRSKVDKATAEAKRDRKRRLSNRKITWREIKNRIDNAKDRLKPGEVKTWDKKNNRWVSNKEDVDEAVATAAVTSPLWGPKALGLAMTGVGLIGTYLQSRKKKEKEEDLLGAVRKKQAEIQQDVANKETLKKNEKLINQDKQKGEHVIRKKAPENEFAGDVINNQGPAIKPGSGTKKGGVWDKLPKGKSSNWSGNNLTGIAKEVQKNQNKIKLKDFIKKKYGNKDQLTGGTLPEHFKWRENLKA